MNKILAIYFFIAVIFFGIGIGIGFFVFHQCNQEEIVNGHPNTFKAGWEAARKKLEESHFLPGSSKEIHTIDGRIKDKKESYIIIEARLFNPLDDESLKERKIKITPETKIFIREEKDRNTIKKEREEYNQQVQDFRNGKINKLPPVPEIFTEKEANFGDLKTGQVVTIESSENIRSLKEFTATKIVVR